MRLSLHETMPFTHNLSLTEDQCIPLAWLYDNLLDRTNPILA